MNTKRKWAVFTESRVKLVHAAIMQIKSPRVYEKAFEFILRNVYIFKLPLVDDRNTIWFVWHHWRLTLLEKEISNFCP